MSYQEKRTIVSILSGIIILAAYCIYVYGKFQAGAITEGDMKFWAVTMLVFVGIGIAATIIIQIIFHIFFSITVAIQEQIGKGKCDDKEIGKTIEAEMVTDEMDKLIELKSMRTGFVVAGIGFIVALAAIVLNYSTAVMVNIIYISFHLGSLLEGFSQLYYYRKGIKYG